MRFTCIALAAVALALAKQQHRAPGLSPVTTSHTYAVAAPAGAAAGTDAPLAAPADGEIDFTPLPAADDTDAADAAARGTALIPQNDTTRCVTVRQGASAAALVVASCGDALAAQSFAYVGGEIRTAADLCVTAPEQSDNAVRPVALAPCNGSASQQWAATAAGEFRGYRGTCLTAAAGLSRRQGTPLAVRGCMGRADQQWARRTASAARVDSIRVNAVALSLPAGRSTQLHALAIGADGRELLDEAVSWTSADPAVATVSPGGVVTATGSGSTALVAMARGRVKSIPVEVRGALYAGAESGTATAGSAERR
jgi:hypothetical protein